MSVLNITHYLKDPILRTQAKKVGKINRRIQHLIDDMIDTMQHANGVGLAAPQVGVPLRLIVVKVPDEPPQILINPEIIKSSGSQEFTEGCLSVPGYCGKLTRSAEVTVKGKNREGKLDSIKATGLKAEAIQHEIDHLNGILYIDRLSEPVRPESFNRTDKESKI
jgi:peptide deformylase